MGILKSILFILLMAACIGFAVHNDGPVSLRWYFNLESMPLPLFLWGFLFLFIGIVLAGIAAFLIQLGWQARIRQMKKTVADLEQIRNQRKSEIFSD